MRGGRNWNRLRDRIEPSRHALGVEARKLFCQMCAERCRVEERAAPCGNLSEYAARHDIARGEVTQRIERPHEAITPAVDECRAFAAQGLGRKRCGIAADIQGGRMKLHEFGISNDRARAGGDCEALSACFRRICRDRIEMADAAGRQHDCARREHDGSCCGIARLAQLQAGHRIAVGQQGFGGETLVDAD